MTGRMLKCAFCIAIPLFSVLFVSLFLSCGHMALPSSWWCSPFLCSSAMCSCSVLWRMVSIRYRRGKLTFQKGCFFNHFSPTLHLRCLRILFLLRSLCSFSLLLSLPSFRARWPTLVAVRTLSRLVLPTAFLTFLKQASCSPRHSGSALFLFVPSLVVPFFLQFSICLELWWRTPSSLAWKLYSCNTRNMTDRDKEQGNGGQEESKETRRSVVSPSQTFFLRFLSVSLPLCLAPRHRHTHTNAQSSSLFRYLSVSRWPRRRGAKGGRWEICFPPPVLFKKVVYICFFYRSLSCDFLCLSFSYFWSAFSFSCSSCPLSVSFHFLTFSCPFVSPSLVLAFSPLFLFAAFLFGALFLFSAMWCRSCAC